ncbi:aminotransferase class III-fold pyridoxal phosphate-dependent enzyme, partial [bacterium]|nr:aminotransferase class III-fold pyridoxal phosphate-dependent enzyme [bacterium]
VGAQLRAGLEGLAETSPLVGDVRGRGLFLGVEIVDDGAPAPTIAREIIEEMRRRGGLIGITGWGKNLLKIRPPLCLTKANADQIVETLSAVLASPGIARPH